LMISVRPSSSHVTLGTPHVAKATPKRREQHRDAVTKPDLGFPQEQRRGNYDQAHDHTSKEEAHQQASTWPASEASNIGVLPRKNMVTRQTVDEGTWRYVVDMHHHHKKGSHHW
jgi:hypothetical protein